jgi:hypothetical protein
MAPAVPLPGKNGKQAMMRLPELPVEPLNEHRRSRAELALVANGTKNDVSREIEELTGTH